MPVAAPIATQVRKPLEGMVDIEGTMNTIRRQAVKDIELLSMPE
jgi:hypothetical protein